MTVWLLTFNFIHFMAAFWAVFTFGGSGPDITAHGSLDLKQEIQIQIQIESVLKLMVVTAQGLPIRLCQKIHVYSRDRSVREQNNCV
jgi:hypothetical protein